MAKRPVRQNAKRLQSDSWINELTIRFSDGEEETFYIELTKTGTFVMPDIVGEPPAWTQLSYHRCPCCPLDDNLRFCPAAESLQITLHRLRDRYSYEDVRATIVDAENRSTVVDWQLQEVGSMFVQLAVFSTACPIGKQFKQMLRDLRPFSTNQELSKHLIGKFLLKHRGEVEQSKLAIMKQLEPLRIVFNHLALRMADATTGDAVANSIINLDAFALNTSIHMEEAFQDLIQDLGWEQEGEEPPAVSEATPEAPVEAAALDASLPAEVTVSSPTLWQRIGQLLGNR
jgi:hypothetical protein